MGRTAPRFAGASFDVGWIGVSGWLAACLTLLAVHGILAVSPQNYILPTHEGGWVESLTAVAYLLAGALLLAAAWAETRRAARFVFLAGSVAMAFIAGEEISWGQRILGFATPDFLAHNRQGEFNVHNLPGPEVKFLYDTFYLFMTLLCLTAAAALFSRKRGLFGIPLPSLPLLLALLAMASAKNLPKLPHLTDIGFWFWLFGRWEITLLLLIATWALFCKRPAGALAAAATLILCLTCLHVRWHSDIIWYLAETREFLHGLFWLCCAGELLHGTRRSAAVKVADGRREGAFPLLPAISYLVLAGCAGLLALTHFNIRMERPELVAALGAVRFATPDIRAEFDLHLADRQLTYFKEPCDQADVDAGVFFLHIFPKDGADLPRNRKRYGFNNLDFAFRKHGARIQGTCVAVLSLPDYPIASIHTGQYDGHGHLWNAVLFVAE